MQKIIYIIGKLLGKLAYLFANTATTGWNGEVNIPDTLRDQ